MTNDEALAGLQPQARNCALRLLMQFPILVLTSGLRNPDDQARAMAQNVFKAGIQWILNTYAPSSVKAACVVALSALQHTGTDWDQAGIAATLAGVFAKFSPHQLRELSVHLSGMAFDLEPIEDERAPQILSAIREEIIAIIQAGGSAKFLDREGGLVRWHIEIPEPDPTQP